MRSGKLLFMSAQNGIKEKFDYHIHSVFSDGQNSLEECVRSAIEKGLSEIAFTDHVWRTSEWVGTYAGQIKELRERCPGLKIWIGLEAKALNLKGDVDIKPEDVEKIDFLIGAVHRRLLSEPNIRYHDLAALTSQEAAEIEKDTIAAMVENPYVDVVAHPMRLYYKFYYLQKTSDIYPMRVLRNILLSVKNKNKLIELNFEVPNLEDVFHEYLKMGVSFTLGSDAHSHDVVGEIPYETIGRLWKERQRY